MEFSALSASELVDICVDSLVDMVFPHKSDEYRARVADGLRKAHVQSAWSFREIGAPALLDCGVPEDACIVLVSKGLVNRGSPKEHTRMGREYCDDPERRESTEIIHFIKEVSLPANAQEKALLWLSKDENWEVPHEDYPNLEGLLSVISSLVPVRYKYEVKKPGALDWYNGYLKCSLYKMSDGKLSWLMFVGGRLSYHACIGGLIHSMHELFMQQQMRAFAYGVVISDEGDGHFIEFFRFRFDNLWLPISTGKANFATFGLPLLMKTLCTESSKLGEEVEGYSANGASSVSP